MAHSNLPTFPFSGFPQVLNQLVGGEIRRIEHVLYPLQVNNHILVPLSRCENSSAESCWGAGDSVSCRAQATVFDLVTEAEYCLGCFEEVSRG